MRAIQTSPERSRRRATLSGRRTKKGTIVGFHGRASGTLVDLKDCALLAPQLLAALPTLHAVTEAGNSRKGELALTVTESESGVDLAVTWAASRWTPNLFQKLAALAESADLARITWEGETGRHPSPALAKVRQGFGRAAGRGVLASDEGRRGRPAGRRARSGGQARGALPICFPGREPSACRLAEQAEVHAAESEKPMLAALEAGFRKAGFRACTGSRPKPATCSVARLLPDELNRHDAVVLDPPRAGAEAQVRELAQSKVKVIAYVSCNPVTFARDARHSDRRGVPCWTGCRWSTSFRWSPMSNWPRGCRAP